MEIEGQLSMFDIGKTPLKITKPIRLIELFAGIGSQAKALKRLGADFEHYKVIEYDKNAVKSYNAIHGTNFSPVDIRELQSLDVTETDRYCYLLTYSFPCTDLSLVGGQKGMKRDSGTQSSLLWEVERLLKECKEKPQILLMENVPQIHTKHINEFQEWINVLSELGYTSKWFDMTASDYGVPQTRKRTFMLSWLGDHTYEVPKPIGCKERVKDRMEASVNEKYYYSEESVEKFVNNLSDKGRERLRNALQHDCVVTGGGKVIVR